MYVLMKNRTIESIILIEYFESRYFKTWFFELLNN